MTCEIRRIESTILNSVSLMCAPLMDTSVRIDATVQRLPATGKNPALEPYASLFIYGRPTGFSPGEFRTLLRAAQSVLEKAEAELARAQRGEPEHPLQHAVAPGKKKRVRKPKTKQ